MFPSDFLIFLQIILFLFITPGLPRVVIVSHTLNYGLKRSVWTALGDVSANTIQESKVDKTIEKFVHHAATQRYFRSNRHPFTKFEVRNGLLGCRKDGMLTGDKT